MKGLLIRGGKVIDPAQGISGVGDLLTVNGKIAPLSKEIPGEYEVLEAAKLVVCPGFIDLHCHLREPGFEDKETIATGTAAAVRGGFTTLCCMPNTNPPVDNEATVNYIKSAALRASVRVLPIGCISRGRKGQELAEIGEMASAGVVALSDDGSPVSSARLMRRAMEYARHFDLPVTSHCEELSLSEGGQMNEGIVATRLGLQGIPAAAEEVMVARDLALAKLTGARLHIAHVSTAGSVELVRRAREQGVRVTAEVTPHHLTLTEEKVLGYDTNAKVNPPLRTKRDIEALIKGLNEGVIDIIATDHAPHTEVDKLCEFALAASGISGLETALGSLMGLVHGGQITLETLIARLTEGPARIIGEKYGLGTLKIGAPADVTILDPDAEWTVDPKTFASKGKNTPLAGARLKGKVVATIAGGKLVYKDERVKIGKGKES